MLTKDIKNNAPAFENKNPYGSNKAKHLLNCTHSLMQIIDLQNKSIFLNT